ncbi:hypothetical protein BJB45_19125 [Halomonas huangheensis]|uniref:Uncharacterized protein n=1 Tax=Halomonas huangheensis TaxID=1178482 RepID=W1N6E6_9GAMM|nr:hypothetical protein AR456_19305 [Halomonas huangheensis]ERL51084.1 hypothetical protein BJB45_19125 [Halomonas huangheensis]
MSLTMGRAHIQALAKCRVSAANNSDVAADQVMIVLIKNAIVYQQYLASAMVRRKAGNTGEYRGKRTSRGPRIDDQACFQDDAPSWPGRPPG